MNAKDTVMKKEELTRINNNMPSEAKYGDVFEAIAERQAEISVKAGRRDVVEWIMKYRSETTREFMGFTIMRDKWQAQLKAWGVTNVQT